MKTNFSGYERLAARCCLTGTLLACLLPFVSAQAAVIDEVKTAVDSINTRTKTINTKVTSIKGQTNLIAPIQTTVGEVQTTLLDLPSAIQSAIGANIDPEMKDEILDVIEKVRATLDQQAADLTSFGDGSPGTGCHDFRESMKSLAHDSIDTMFLMQSIGGSTLPDIPIEEIDLIAGTIDILDCKLLLPAWLAFTKTPIGDLADPLTETRDALKAIMPLFDTSEIDLASMQVQTSQMLSVENALPIGLSAVIVPVSCSDIEARQNYISAGALILKQTSLKMQVIGAKVDPMIFKGGGPIVNPAFRFGDKTVGIHGYGMLEIKKEAPPQPTKLAKFAQFVGKILGEAADWASNKVDACIDAENQDRLYRNQVVILTEICSVSRTRSPACQELLE